MIRLIHKRVLLGVAAMMFASVAQAQNAQTPVLLNPPEHPFNPPGAPQTVGGGPAEAANTDPRDFSGVWIDKPSAPAANYSIGDNPPLTPQGQAIYDHRLQMFEKATPIASPHMTCRPTGVDATLNPHLGVVVMQTKRQIAFISEEDRNVRQVLLGKSHPAKLAPTYMGNSVGHWEGDTLVVDTVGFNGLGWLDEKGVPSSNKLHMVERISKSADGTELDWDVTLYDPTYFTRPFRVKRRWAWASGVVQLEYDCEQNAPNEERNMVFENEQLRPICAQKLASGDAPDRVVCSKPTPAKR